MSEVVSQVTWQRWKARDLGNNNHIAQALLAEEQTLAAKESLESSQPLLCQANEPTAIFQIWTPARDPNMQCRHRVLIRDEVLEQRKGMELGPHQKTRAPARFCLLHDLGQILSPPLVFIPSSVR